MNLDDAIDNLLKTTENNTTQPIESRKRSAEWTPGVQWDGNEGVVTTLNKYENYE